MEKENVKVIAGVRFNKVGKIYHFNIGPSTDVQVGDAVVVETSRGWQMGFVVVLLDPPEAKGSENLKTIDRIATPKDLAVRQMWQQKEVEVVEYCRQKLIELKLPGIKVIDAEYSFDGKRLAIFYSAETEGSLESKGLRKDLNKRFSNTKVELRVLGPRDVAKSICGLGACGKDIRCCCSFITEFSSISIRMAKNQGISLTPTEITGMCGRLRCCLIYENDQYEEGMKGLPAKNKRIKTPQGEGKVVEVRPLKEEIVIEIKEVGKKVFTKEEYKKMMH